MLSLTIIQFFLIPVADINCHASSLYHFNEKASRLRLEDFIFIFIPAYHLDDKEQLGDHRAADARI